MSIGTGTTDPYYVDNSVDPPVDGFGISENDTPPPGNITLTVIIAIPSGYSSVQIDPLNNGGVYDQGSGILIIHIYANSQPPVQNTIPINDVTNNGQNPFPTGFNVVLYDNTGSTNVIKGTHVIPQGTYSYGGEEPMLCYKKHVRATKIVFKIVKSKKR